MKPLLVIPAAGQSARMRGADKLLEEVGGRSLLRRQAMAALETGCPVVVMLPPDTLARRAALSGLHVTIVEVPDAAEGMGATLRAAARLPDEGQALAVLLPDVPGLGSADIVQVVEAFERAGSEQVTRATDPDGRPGTPVIFPHPMLRRFSKLTGDDGGRWLIDKATLVTVPFPDTRATRDLDTPEDWVRWRSDMQRIGKDPE